jgi:hypothetical protein
VKKGSQTQIQVESVLGRLLPYLKNQSAVRLKTHLRAIEDIHQTLANRGIDLLQEQAFLKFMEQCRTFLNEDIEKTWALIQQGLTEPHPPVCNDTSSKILTALNDAVSSSEIVLGYFEKFEERLGRPQLKELVDKLRSEVANERMLLMQVKQLEAEKFIELVQREETQRLQNLPTYFDEKLRWIKNRPFLVWGSLIISGIGILGGLSVVLNPLKEWACQDKPVLQCVSSMRASNLTISASDGSVKSEDLGAVKED